MSDIGALTEKIHAALTARRWKLVTAESCTGGMVAAALTELGGASDIFDRGFVTYSNEAKMELLRVPAETLEKHGAVSAETANGMAKGALENAHADIAVSITGIAGPGGGSAQKPVGLVWFGCARRNPDTGQIDVSTRDRQFAALGRNQVRQDATLTALEIVLDAIQPVD